MMLDRVVCGLMAYVLIFVMNTPNVMASAEVCRTVPCVLSNVQLDKHLKVLKTVIQDSYAYILVVSPDRWLYLYQALLSEEGRWVKVGGVGTPIVDKPGAWFRSKRANLEYTLSRPHGSNGDKDYRFDWCLFGYTTDSQVIRFRMKTKVGYIPLETIEDHYFIRVLTESEREQLVEVQGLNAKGEVVQRDDGAADDKPRQWSPRHSEF